MYFSMVTTQKHQKNNDFTMYTIQKLTTKPYVVLWKPKKTYSCSMVTSQKEKKPMVFQCSRLRNQRKTMVCQWLRPRILNGYDPDIFVISVIPRKQIVCHGGWSQIPTATRVSGVAARCCCQKISPRY